MCETIFCAKQFFMQRSLLPSCTRKGYESYAYVYEAIYFERTSEIHIYILNKPKRDLFQMKHIMKKAHFEYSIFWINQMISIFYIVYFDQMISSTLSICYISWIMHRPIFSIQHISEILLCAYRNIAYFENMLYFDIDMAYFRYALSTPDCKCVISEYFQFSLSSN